MILARVTTFQFETTFGSSVSAMECPKKEKFAQLRYLINTMTIRYLLAHRFSGKALTAVLRGVRDGLFSKPDLSDDFSRVVT